MASKGLRRVGRCLLGLTVIVTLVVGSTPALLYGYGLHLIPDENFAPSPTPVSEVAERVFWTSLGGSGSPSLAPTSPYHAIGLFWKLSRRDLRAEASSAPVDLSGSTARVLLQRTRIRGGMAGWHLASLSAAIWVARHWSASEAIATVLERAYFGHDFVGLDAAAEGYFGIPARELDEARAAVLMVVLEAAGLYDPWCHVEKNLRVTRVLLQRLSLPRDLPAISLLPAPPGACRK